MSDAESAKTQTHSAKTALFHRFSPNGSALWRPHPLKARTGRQHAGGIALHGGPTRRRHAASHLLMLQNPHRHWCGGRRRDRGARLRCPWAVAVPGWAIHSDPAPLVWRAPEGPRGQAAVPVGGGGAWPGFETTRRAKLAARTARGRAAAHGHNQQPGPTGRASARNTRGATSKVRTEHTRHTRHYPEHSGRTQQRARSPAAPRAPRVCQWLTG